MKGTCDVEDQVCYVSFVDLFSWIRYIPQNPQNFIHTKISTFLVCMHATVTNKLSTYDNCGHVFFKLLRVIYNLCSTGLEFSSQNIHNYTVILISNNQNLSLDCKAFSMTNCSLSYKWQKDAKQIYNSNHYKIFDSVLLINSLTLEDAGQYKCTAFNSMGDAVNKVISVLTVRYCNHFFIFIILHYYIIYSCCSQNYNSSY